MYYLCEVEDMETSTTQAVQEYSKEKFKQEMFVWEMVITAIVFVTAYYALRAFKKYEDRAKEKNKKYNTGM
jgi:hypothetical protein